MTTYLEKELEKEDSLEELQAPISDATEEIVKRLEAKIQELEKDRLLIIAEAENRCRRIETHNRDREQFAISSFAKDLLSIADSLQCALNSNASSEESGVLAGIQLTSSLLNTVFEKFGVVRIQALHQAFNPELHQAMQEVPSSEHAKGIVVRVMQDGYMLHNRVLRAALVVVSCGSVQEVQ